MKRLKSYLNIYEPSETETCRLVTLFWETKPTSRRVWSRKLINSFAHALEETGLILNICGNVKIFFLVFQNSYFTFSISFLIVIFFPLITRLFGSPCTNAPLYFKIFSHIDSFQNEKKLDTRAMCFYIAICNPYDITLQVLIDG